MLPPQPQGVACEHVPSVGRDTATDRFVRFGISGQELPPGHRRSASLGGLHGDPRDH